MSKSIHWLICFLILTTSAFAQQLAPKHQNSSNDSVYLVPKSGRPIQNQPLQRAAPAKKEKPSNNSPLIELQAKYPNARIVLHDETGLPSIISNIQSERRTGTAVQIARDFLRAHRDVLMPSGDIAELELIEVVRSQKAIHVHFQQVYQSIPIYLGVSTVHMQDGRVVMYTGAYRPTTAFRGLPLQPTLGESEATELAMERLSLLASVWLRGEVKVKLYIYPSQGNTYHLAYQVKLPAGAPLGDWEFLIDAHTGEILQQNDLLMHVDGEASVYEENPITTRNTVNKVLPNLDGSGFLRGDFVNILIYSGPSGVRVDSRDFNNSLSNNASSRQHDFRYNPANDPRFDEANVYFHINRIHDYFKDTFDFIKLDEPLPVIVDHPAIDDRNGRILNRPMNNAFFSPFMRRLAIGTGTGTASGGLNNLARDADVLYHEYTHAVINEITRLGIRPDDFGRAMNEAYADYFPCSFFNDADMGEWAVSNRRGMRNLDNNQRFPDDIFQPRLGEPEEHFTGLIWGGACWTLRERIGAREADQIIFNSLFFLPRNGSANFQIGLTALLQADESVLGGTHQGTIRQLFNDRGICESAGCPLVSGISTRASISSVELLGVNQYTIEVPDNATELQVELRAIQSSRDIDLYVRFNRSVVVQTGFSRQPVRVADFRSEGERGTESITITPESEPGLRGGTYYVAIVNWTDTSSTLSDKL